MVGLKHPFSHYSIFTGINWALYLATLALGYKVFTLAIKEKGASKKVGVFISMVIIIFSLVGLLYIGVKKICFELKYCEFTKSCPISEQFKERHIEIPTEK
ncbi:MAG: hypothetical protein FJZ16_00275 [Candidatus Omnitrophica bacterium]|nr:hypothetical protein [Candidatus Omnitrophota bacterium]